MRPISFFARARFIIPIVVLVFVFACSRIPALAEAYMRMCYPAVATVLSFFSRWMAFSLLDVLVVALIIMLIVSVVLMLLKRMLFRRWAGIVVLSIMWIAAWFYMSWGIGYFRPKFYERFDVAPAKDDAFFEALVTRYIDSLNCAYTIHTQYHAVEIDRELEALYEQHHNTLQLPYPCGWRHTKKTATQPLMTRMGIAGYFDPFFNEVQVNTYALPLTLPYTLAHEKAHQFGIADEAECNLYATIICTNSQHPLVRYSGYLQTVSYLLNNLRKISQDKYSEIAGRIDPRIKEDYRAIREHWQKGISPTLSAMQDKVYDAYLKTNQQQSGIHSYSEMTALLTAWEMFKNR